MGVGARRSRDRLLALPRPRGLGGEEILLTTFQESEGLAWSDPWLQSIDLEYHNVSLEQGLYYELMREGQMRRLVSEDEIRHAIFHPPETTRAFFRGVRWPGSARRIESIQWDEIVLASGQLKRSVELAHPAHDAGLDRINTAIREAKSFEELVRRPGLGRFITRLARALPTPSF